MSKTKKILLAAIMLFCVSFAVVSLMAYNTIDAIAAGNDTNQDIYQLEQQLAAAKKETAALQQKIKDAQAQQLSYQQTINNLDAEIEVLTRQISLIESLSAEWNEDLVEIDKEVAELEIKMEDEILAFESMLRMGYQYGNDTYFNIIFGSENISDFLSRADMISYHLKANDNIVSGLSETIMTLEEKKTVQQNSIAAISAYGTEQNTLQAELEKKSAEALAKKNEFATNEVTLTAELKSKQAEMDEMDAEIKRLYEESKKNGTLTEWDGSTLYVPTINYRISSEFSVRKSPITGKIESHNGLDMAAPGGTPIYAAADGTVIDSRRSSSWGEVIKVDHGNGLITLYAHCSVRLVSVGQTVKRGQQIAKVGSTGWSTGNHLHFTVYQNGVAVNPRDFLPKNI